MQWKISQVLGHPSSPKSFMKLQEIKKKYLTIKITLTNKRVSYRDTKGDSLFRIL